MNSDDARTVKRALAGDVSAFGAIHAAHAARVKTYFLRCGFEPADADDLTQDSFIQTFRSLGTFDAVRGTLGGWIAAIARNNARKHFNRRADDRNYDPELAEQILQAPDNPAGDAGRREETRAVNDCVTALPDDLARIVRLRYVEGMTTRGIAAETHIPEATVRTRLREALGAVERCLKGKGVLR